jgi:transcriptional regulator with XRE-family HTH domain
MRQADAATAIKGARKARGWTQQEFAHYADLTTKTVSNMENGIKVSDRSLRKAAATLGLDFPGIAPSAAAS